MRSTFSTPRREILRRFGRAQAGRRQGDALVLPSGRNVIGLRHRRLPSLTPAQTQLQPTHHIANLGDRRFSASSRLLQSRFLEGAFLTTLRCTQSQTPARHESRHLSGCSNQRDPPTTVLPPAVVRTSDRMVAQLLADGGLTFSQSFDSRRATVRLRAGVALLVELLGPGVNRRVAFLGAPVRIPRRPSVRTAMMANRLARSARDGLATALAAGRVGGAAVVYLSSRRRSMPCAVRCRPAAPRPRRVPYPPRNGASTTSFEGFPG